MTDYLSRCISDWGVDVYRQDRNHYPHLYWQTANAPDRVGITEIRHVEGLYAMWDDSAQGASGPRDRQRELASDGAGPGSAYAIGRIVDEQ